MDEEKKLIEQGIELYHQMLKLIEDKNITSIAVACDTLLSSVALRLDELKEDFDLEDFLQERMSNIINLYKDKSLKV